MKYFNLTGTPVTYVETIASLPNELGDKLTEYLSRGVEKDAVNLSALMNQVGIRGFIIDPANTPTTTKHILRKVSQLRGDCSVYSLSAGQLVPANV